MEYTKLGKTDIEISKVCVGCMSFGKAGAKEKHAMRDTQYRGLAQATNWVKLKFAAMHLKKLAVWKWNDHFRLVLFHFFRPVYTRNPLAA